MDRSVCVRKSFSGNIPHRIILTSYIFDYVSEHVPTYLIQSIISSYIFFLFQSVSFQTFLKVNVRVEDETGWEGGRRAVSLISNCNTSF